MPASAGKKGTSSLSCKGNIEILTFYPLSDGLSTKNHRIIMTDLRLCLTCKFHSQAGFCHYTLQLITDQFEPTVAHLRYSLVGDRPSQTTRLTKVPSPDKRTMVSIRNNKGWYFTLAGLAMPSKSSHLAYTIEFR